jgi:hypothetical protein
MYSLFHLVVKKDVSGDLSRSLQEPLHDIEGHLVIVSRVKAASGTRGGDAQVLQTNRNPTRTLTGWRSRGCQSPMLGWRFW